MFKTEHSLKHIKDIGKEKLGSTNNKVEKSLPTGKNKKVIRMTKNDLGRTVMKTKNVPKR